MRGEIEEAVGKLRAEVNVSRAAERSEVIDLPALPLRNRNAA